MILNMMICNIKKVQRREGTRLLDRSLEQSADVEPSGGLQIHGRFMQKWYDSDGRKSRFFYWNKWWFMWQVKADTTKSDNLWVAICITNDEFCITNDEFCIKIDDINANVQAARRTFGDGGCEYRSNLMSATYDSKESLTDCALFLWFFADHIDLPGNTSLIPMLKALEEMGFVDQYLLRPIFIRFWAFPPP